MNDSLNIARLLFDVGHTHVTVGSARPISTLVTNMVLAIERVEHPVLSAMYAGENEHTIEAVAMALRMGVYDTMETYEHLLGMLGLMIRRDPELLAYLERLEYAVERHALN